MLVLQEDYIRGGTQKNFYTEADREFCNCPLCGQNDFTKLDAEKGLDIVQCNHCTLMYTNPRAKDTQENYFGDAGIFYNEARMIFKESKPHHRDVNYVYELKKIKKFKPRGLLLDVGSNMGFFLRKARAMGFDVEGVEPSPALAKIARENWKLTVHNSFLEEAVLPKNTYDVITLIDVFEHVTDPRGMLKASYDLLKPDGILAIKVPNGEYTHFKMKLGRLTGKGSAMDIWDSFEHVVHYTPKTFAKMVESCGYKVKTCFIPLPVHSPIWSNLVGHYYQYPSPFILDWKRIMLRNLFFRLGQLEFALRGRSIFGPDLMFIVEKNKTASA